MEYYRPGAIVMQCGADSLSYDKLGDFCLTVKGHGECVNFVKKFNLPILLLGGGGYTIENVSRAWANETGICLEEELPNDLPITDFYNKYGPDYKLNIKPANHPNLNEKGFLDELVSYSLENLKNIEFAPNVENDMPIDLLSEEANEVRSKLVRTKDNANEFDDYDDKK